MARGFESEHVGKHNGSARFALRSTAEDLIDDIAELRKDAVRLADAANKAARAEVKYGKKRLERIAHDVRSTAEDRARKVRKQVRDQVRTRPGTALGIALGVGVLIGIMGLARTRH